MPRTDRSDFVDMLERQAPGSVPQCLPMGRAAAVVAHRHAQAHEFINPGTPHLGVLVVPHFRLSQALFDLGNGLRDHYCPEPQPVHLLPPDTAYRWTVNGESMTVLLALPMAELQAILGEIDAPDAMHSLGSIMDRGFVEPMVCDMVLRLWRQARAGQPVPTLLVQSYATCIVHALLSRARARQPAPPARSGLNQAQLARVVALIEDRLDSDLGLDELAALCRLSRFHFARQFRQSTGQTPFQYLLRRRIDKAKLLLMTTRQSVAEVGLAVGFNDAGHFSRSFARQVGASPRQYRAAGH